jgi:hypothetical protein
MSGAAVTRPTHIAKAGKGGLNGALQLGLSGLTHCAGIEWEGVKIASSLPYILIKTRRLKWRLDVARTARGSFQRMLLDATIVELKDIPQKAMNPLSDPPCL